MSSERDKPSRSGESVARPTARDVPFTRGTDSELEPAPRGQRPAQLPRDPTYEAELAQVDLAVLRDPKASEDPSTKQGGRRGYAPSVQAPESVTPESPGTRAARQAAHGATPEPPTSAGRAVASGTLLSVGAVDPRGKTEKNLETPRMFISQADADAEVYFRPGKIPAVTVHQTIETETVLLSDSVDPRRAKTLPRLDRAQLAQLADARKQHEPDSAQLGPESDHAMAVSPRSIPDLVPPSISPRWQGEEEYAFDSISSAHDGQIHASLSQFRGDSTPSFSLDGAPTRPEPLAARRASDPPPASAPPDASAVPTHRDLPAHRIEASQPPPPPVVPRISQALTIPSQARLQAARDEETAPLSEGPRPTAASIAAEEPEARPVWHNYVAFVAALLIAVAVGLWWTQAREQPPITPPESVRLAPPSPPALVKAPPAVREAAPREPIATQPPAAPVPEPALTAPRKEAAVVSKPAAPARAPAAESPPPAATPAAPAPRATTPAKPVRETIF